MDRLEQRLTEIETMHQADLRARDAEIARLQALLESRPAPGTQPTTAATIDRRTRDALGEIDGAAPKSAAADEIERIQREVLKDIASRDPISLTPRPGISFNPDFAVISDFVGSVSTNNATPSRNRLDVREVELDLRAAVDPRADAVAIMPVSREVDDPLFFRRRGDAGGGVDTSIEIEEAYLSLHDFGAPNLTAKLGRFHLRFGRWNILHKHDWITTDNNFVNQSFLGDESLNDAGLSLSYVVPPKYTRGEYVEALVEVVSGEGNDGPVLNNNASVHSPAVNTHLLWNHDFGRSKDWNLEVGGSWLNARHNNDDRQHANLFGADATLVHTDPAGRFNNQLFQLEAIYGDVDASRKDHEHSFGAFFLAQQQFRRDWYGGVRLDWTKNALDDRQEVWGVSPYVAWYWSEFLRFRLEYQHKGGDVKTEDVLYLQATWIFGAHPPHPYWAVK